MNFDQARHNMVEQQVRTWEVLDSKVLDVLQRLHREDFVLPRYRKLAYADMVLPIGDGQFMMKPLVEGRLLQSLALTANDMIFEIGTGSGYLTACLASLGGQVLSVDCMDEFVRQAGVRLERAGISNATLETGDVFQGYDPGRQFDAVVVTGSVGAVPERFRQWVKPGGRLFAVRGRSPVMEAVLMTRQEQGEWLEDSLFETDLPRLLGAEDPETLGF